MARSVLLQLTRDSILEVYQAQNRLDMQKLLSEHPVLQTPMNVRVNIYLDNELFSSHTTNNEKTLLKNIIVAAKKAAFEEMEHILSATNYLHAEIELTLFTPDGAITERDKALFDSKEPLPF